MKYKKVYLIDDGKNDGLFKLKVGGDKSKLIHDETAKRKVRVVSNTALNNGVESTILNNEIGIKNCITIGTRGNDYFACYQDDYTVTIVRALLLHAEKFKLDKYIAFYICALLRKNSYKCAYGRVLSGTLAQLEKIPLPIKNNEEPDWNYIRNIGKSFYKKVYNSTNNSPAKRVQLNLDDREWVYFSFPELFTITKGERLIKEDRVSGDTLYFSASEFNNGCTDAISNPLFIEKDAVIYTTFGDAYYVSGEFTASDEISILKNKHLNVFNGLFVATIISQNKYKYSFGRKAFKNKFMNDSISLPITSDGNPDWQFMEDYIKSLPYSSNL